MAKRQLVDAWMETHNVRTLRFEFPEGPRDFKPGQFVMVADAFRGYERPVRRAYSIASTPLDKGFLDITVKRETPGLMSVRLTEAPVGAWFDVADPNGKYLYEPSRGKRILLLGAGSGIVPILSIARFALEKPVEGAQVDVFFSVRTPQDVIYENVWKDLAAKHPNFRCHLTATRAKPSDWTGRHGRISTDWVHEVCGDVSDSVSYICGPGPMVETMEQICRDLSIPEERINTEKW